MAERKFNIKDTDGKLLGTFTAPADATNEQVQRMYKKFKKRLVAKRVEREQVIREKSTLPPSPREIPCSHCGKYFDTKSRAFVEHMEEYNREAGLGEKLSG